MKKTLLLFLICFCISVGSVNDNYQYISVENGLSQSTVNCLLQDKEGFIWIGTSDGLNRYNGHEIEIFKNQFGDNTSISDNFITSIIEDSNKIWIGTRQGGLNVYLKENGTFQSYTDSSIQNNKQNHIISIHKNRSNRIWYVTLDSSLWSLNTKSGITNQYSFAAVNNSKSLNKKISLTNIFDKYLPAVCVDKKGVIWIGTPSGLYTYDHNSDSFINKSYNKNSNKITSIKNGPKGDLWISSWGDGLLHYSHKNKVFSQYKKNNNQGSHSGNFIDYLFADSQGIIWMQTPGGLNCFNHKNKTIKNSSPAFFKNKTHPKNLIPVFEDNKKRTWFSSPFKIYYKEKDKGLVEPGFSQNKAVSSLKWDNINSIIQDNSGIVWIGTVGKGVIKYEFIKKAFHYFQHIPWNPGSLNNNIVFSLFEDSKNNLWIGTGISGLNKYSLQNKEFEFFPSWESHPDSIRNHHVMTICEDSEKRFWAGTYKGGFYQYDREKNKIVKHYTQNQTGLSNNQVKSIIEDSQKNLWIATGNGLNKFNPVSEKFTCYFHEPGNNHSIPENWINTIYLDSQNQIWIGSSSGFSSFDNKTNRFTNYTSLNPLGKPEPIGKVLSIYENNLGQFWIGTEGNGIFRYNVNTGNFSHFTTKNGLPNNVVYSILKDNNHHFWISTNKGLSKFNPQKENPRFINFNSMDGLLNEEFNRGAFLKSKSGMLYFGGVNGVTFFHPDSIIRDPKQPLIAFTNFKIFDDIVLPGKNSPLKKTLNFTEKIWLKHWQNDISFEFAALHYGNPEKNQYMCILKNYDSKWRELGNKNNITFTNLDPGNYSFHVIASNKDGVWNKKGISVEISIMPPWWKTKYAYLFYLIIVVTILYGFRKYDVKRLNLKNALKLKELESKKLKEMDQVKTKFFENISHEFRTPLTLIIDPLEQMETGQFKGNTQKYYGIMKQNAKHLLNLINQLLDLSKFDYGKMKLKASNCDLVKHIKSRTLLFSTLAQNKKIDFSFESSKKSIDAWVDLEKMDKIIYNLLGNAFKFTPDKGEIKVTLSLESGQYSALPELNNKEYTKIIIYNSGQSISAKDTEKIFNRFFQASEFNKQGFGIGLSLTRELVQLHHGNIMVDRNYKKGIAFIIYLPVGKGHLSKNEILENDQHQVLKEIPKITLESGDAILENTLKKPDNKNPRILIIEDNYEVLQYIKENLEAEYTISLASNGQKGMEAALKTIPDLIISDIMMPVMNGVELCRSIKANEKTNHIPVVLLTAKAEQDTRIASLETGADDFLTKPFNSKELLARINNLILQRKMLRERYSKEIFLMPDNIIVSSLDSRFIKKAKSIIEENISNTNFGVEVFSKEIGMSRVQLYRKIQALTGQTVNEFIRNIRLKRAAGLISQKYGTISEIAYEVGFNNPTYFSKCFSKQYGISPSEYAGKTNPSQF